MLESYAYLSQQAQQAKKGMEDSRQKVADSGKPISSRSLKPLTEPKDVDFHTSKRQRTQEVQAFASNA